MAIYSFHENFIQKIEATNFSAENILERQNLQLAIKNQIDAIAPDCLVIAEEASEWEDSLRRIDLLAIDKNANIVVIELKRTEKGEHMELQALRYAAMISTLTFSRATKMYQNFLHKSGREEDAENLLLSFLDWEEPQEDSFALDVRIVLVSANFSKELTTSVMWLNERGLDIRCVRLIPYKHKEQIILDVQQIIPLPEVETYQVKMKQQSEERREARRSSRDYTQYVFNGQIFNKRKLVLAVIHDWVKSKSPQDLSELTRAFPESMVGGGLFSLENSAKETYERQKISRHFIGQDEALQFSDGSRYAISNQWGKNSIEKFIENAKRIGYKVQEVKRGDKSN